MAVGAPLLKVRNASKSFAGTKALDSVSLTVRSGEVVAVAGQNGSGKSTLVKVLAGIHEPDGGTRIEVAEDAAAAPGQPGLHFIHQDLGLVGMLSTVENLDLSRRLGNGALRPVSRWRERRRAEELLRQFGVSCDVEVPVERLSPAERAVIAIVRALSGWDHDRHVLVLDEPTAALHGREASVLFDAVRQVAARGAGVIFISHHLDEIFSLADRVVVLRDGRLIADQLVDQMSHDELVGLIAGRELASGSQARQDGSPATTRTGSSVLKVRGLRTDAIRSFDLDLRQGEIVGVAGILGSGREQVSRALFGVVDLEAGQVELNGEPVTVGSPRQAIAAGLGWVPADRHRDGAVMTMNARENTTLPRMRPYVRGLGRLDKRSERADVGRLLDAVDVRPAQPDRPFNLFSGGNQQKVVLAKWLRNDPTVLLLDEPTQGVDIGAKDGIYEALANAAADRAAVLVTSSDSRELAKICDRVLVMRDGCVVAEVAGAHLTEERLITEELGGPRGTTDEERTTA